MSRKKGVVIDMGKYDDLAKRIIESIGGKENIIVIGNHVAEVSRVVSNLTGITDLLDAQEREKSWLSRIMDFASGIFAPLLGVLCAVSILKGVYDFSLYIGFYDESNVVWQFLQILSDSFFYFLPVFVGFTAARKFQVNQFTGMLIGACLVYPNRFGMVEQSYRILPVILAVWAASYIERFLKKALSEVGDFLPTIAYITSWAQAGAVLAILFRTRDKRMRSISIPSVISGLLGIAEPGIYGVALPEKKPFFISSICAAAGGGIFTFLDHDHVTTAMNGISFEVIASFTVFVLCWLITMFVYREPKKESVRFPMFPLSLDGKKVIHSPLNGKLVPLMDVGDEVFSSGVLGEGIAIEPYEGIVYAPADCKVTTFFPTGHAIGLTTAEGVELLIHIGVDTVQLNGKYFKPLVKQGENLAEGQPMLKFDSRKIGQEGYRITTSVIVTNAADWKKVGSTTAQETTVGDALLWVG